MDPTVQIDPERCVLVLGSQLSAAALALSEGVPAALSYAMVIDIGVQKMLELEGVTTVEEKSRRQSLLLSAYELEPSFAASKVVESLREHGVYHQWLNELFGSLLALPVHRSQGGVVERLASLQDQGALLVYTYYDTILDVALNTSPVLLTDEDSVRNWAGRQTRGLLHVHGTYSQPNSVCCDCVNYRQLVGEASGAPILKELCRTRTVIFIGFDSEFFDPFLAKFSRTFLSRSQPPPLLLSSSLGPTAAKLPPLDSFLTLKVPQLANLEHVFLTTSPLPRLGPRDSIESKISTTLLYADKASCLDAAERVKVTTEINVHQLTMRTEHLFHHLLLYLDRKGLGELWKILFAHSAPQQEGSSPGLHRGLLGIMLETTVVWLKRSVALGRSTSPVPTPMDTVQGAPDHASNSAPHQLLLPRTCHTPSLTTNVSVISSMWAPIASASVSKPSSTSASTRPTLPSPLISSTSHMALGSLANRGAMAGGVSSAGMQLLHPHRFHPQVRRVQSEKDHLTYRDRLAKQNTLRRNGLLLHTESAPEIVETPPPAPPPGTMDPAAFRRLGGMPQLDHSRTTGSTRSSTVMASAGTSSSISAPMPRPPAAPDRNQLEVKIEYVDQHQKGDISSSSPKLDLQQQRGGMTPLSPRRFAEEKQKFISEAQNWSKQVDSEIAKKMKVEGVKPPGVVHPTPAPLGGFFAAAKMATGQPSMSSKFSQEEREKLLQQHFEQIQQQQQMSANSAPKPPPPHSLSITTPNAATPSPLKLSPHPQPTNSATPSPKKSPFQLPNLGPPSSSAVAANLLPFLSQAAGLQNLPSANFLNPPPVSQFPAAMAFNPIYQAALQQLMAMQVKGSPPMLVSDPSIFQSLMDKVPLFLPDGSITFVPTNPSPQGGGATSPRKEDVPMKSPSADMGNGSGHKRTRSPDAEARMDMRGSPPKRRRSTSLPDITQIPGHKNFKEGGGIKEEPNEGCVPVTNGSPSMSEPRPARQLAPPTMIHIPQDIKMNDPMLGFPTPPQSSPLVGNFALSPIVFSSGYHAHQPMTPVTPNQTPLGAEQLRELVGEAGGAQTSLPMPPSPDGALPPFPAGRGPIQLWQFLLDLLLSPDKKHMIDWTGNGYEFRILQPEEIAKLWGARKNKPRMNYDKLSRGLRYYYSKGIMDKVQGKKLTFKYTCDVQNYVRSRQSPGSARGGKYHSESDSSTPVPGGRGDEGQEDDGMDDMSSVGGGDRSERSFSDLDLMSGFQTAVQKASEGLTGVMGVVSQEFSSLPSSVVGAQPDTITAATVAAGGVALCTQAI